MKNRNSEDTQFEKEKYLSPNFFDSYFVGDIGLWRLQKENGNQR